jgi:hypothetical protein
MRLASILLLGSVAAVACGGSAPVGPDATIFCAKAAYDPCVTEHDCADTSCKTVADGEQVCTQACGGASDPVCPMQDGVAVPCGSGGFCTPGSATACHLNP